MLWILFFVWFFFFVMFSYKAAFICIIFIIFQIPYTMLCKLVSYRCSSCDWGKSRGENWIRPYREAQAQGHLSSSPEPHQDPEASGAKQKKSLEKPGQTGSWCIREGVVSEGRCDPAVREYGTAACRAFCLGRVSRKGSSDFPGGTNR